MHRCAGGLWLQGHTARASLLCSVGKIFHCVRYLSAAPRISIWNKEELPEEWKELIIVSIYKKGDKTDCGNCRAYHFCSYVQNLANILLSRLTPYAEEIIGDHHGGFRCNRSTTDHIFCINQYLRKNGNTTKWCNSSL